MNGRVERACGILVVGGGVSGALAAVAAARRGASVLLVEKRSFLGGAGIAGMHQVICGLFLADDQLASRPLNPGLVEEVLWHLKKKNPGQGPSQMGKVTVWPYRTEDLLHAYEAITSAEKSMQILYHTRVMNASFSGKRLSAVTVATPEETIEIRPEVVVEASGDGILLSLANIPHELSLPGERQLAGATIRLDGLSGPMDLVSVQVPYHLAQGVRHHELPPLFRLTAFSPGPDAGSGLLKLSQEPGRGQDPQEDAERAWAYLKDHCPGFKESHIAECGEVLDREGPRLLGDYQLTEEDVLSARKFPDGVVKNAWPIEVWDPGRGPTYQYLEPGEYYEIPGRCLKTRAVSNVLCTGRCISVTHRALGSTRVMGTCMALGEAAGAEAARIVNSKPPGRM